MVSSSVAVVSFTMLSPLLHSEDKIFVALPHSLVELAVAVRNTAWLVRREEEGGFL